MIEKYFSLFIFIFLSSCAIGPLTSYETGRSLGQWKSEFSGGLVDNGFVTKWNIGLLDDLDVGLQWETFSFGLRAKYSLMNNKKYGASFALAGGAGSSFGGSHEYGDIILSYLFEDWEPYATLRFVQVKRSDTTASNTDTKQTIFKVQRPNFNYQHYIGGMRYWFNQHWFLGAEISHLNIDTSDVILESPTLYSAGFGYRF